MARTRVGAALHGHRTGNDRSDEDHAGTPGAGDAAAVTDVNESPSQNANASSTERARTDGTPDPAAGASASDVPAAAVRAIAIEAASHGAAETDTARDGSEESSTLSAIAGSVESAAETVAQAVTQTTASLVRGATDLAAGASRRFEEWPGANARRQRRAAREPLPVLWQVHPEAVNAPRHDLGLVAVPVDQIKGTAVEGAQRAGDFRPIPPLRGANWEARYGRIRSAANRLAMLPPVELLKTGDEYWVVDGHNRVAVARELGQIALDASVVELPLPGRPRPTPGPLIGSYLAEDIRDVRAAGSGRHSRTAGPTADLESTEQLRRAFGHDHSHEDGAS